MPKIFISYRRDDTAAWAGRMFDHLKQPFGSANIFMDVDTIRPGADFVEVLEKAVSACDVLIVVIGKNWLNVTDRQGRRRLDDPNDFVRIEIMTGLKRDILVIPVLVDNADMPRQDELPAPLAPLSRRNAIEIRHARFDADLAGLIKHLQPIPQPQPSSIKEKDMPPAGDPDPEERQRAAPEPSPAVPVDPSLVESLIEACKAGRLEEVKTLLNQGADPDAKYKEGWTVLMAAADQGYLEVVKILLEKGADPNAKDGRTVLSLTARNNPIKVLKRLFHMGADPNAKDKLGDTALILAALNGHLEVAKLLLEKGVDPNVRATDGRTVLDVVPAECRSELSEMVKASLRRGKA